MSKHVSWDEITPVDSKSRKLTSLSTKDRFLQYQHTTLLDRMQNSFIFDLPLVEYILINHPCYITFNLVNELAEQGQLEALQYLYKNHNINSLGKLNMIFTIHTMQYAVKSGNLDLVIWLDKNTNIACTPYAMDVAIETGNIKIAEYLYQNRNEGCNRNAVLFAIKNNNLPMTQWVYNRHDEHKLNGFTAQLGLSCAAEHGYTEIIDWYFENITDILVKHAGKSRLLLSIPYIRHNIINEFASMAMMYAVIENQISAVKLLYKKKIGCPPCLERQASKNGCAEVLTWLKNPTYSKYKNKCERCKSGL